MREKQKNLITSLEIQPLIVVIRIEKDFFQFTYQRDKLLTKIKDLSNNGIKHIEIGWDSNKEWINLIAEIKNNFPSINIGAASINSISALDSIIPLDLNYSMSPFYNKELHIKAIKNNQLLIPGISNKKNLKEAIKIGYKIIKVFPASKLGMDFLHTNKEFKERNIFFIGAGGIKSEDIKRYLENGYKAVTIGRELAHQKIDKNLKIWLKSYRKIIPQYANIINIKS